MSTLTIPTSYRPEGRGRYPHADSSKQLECSVPILPGLPRDFSLSPDKISGLRFEVTLFGGVENTLQPSSFEEKLLS